MRAASRFLRGVGTSFGLAVVAAFLASMAGAESVQLGTLVTEIYPEIAVGSTVFERRDPTSLDWKAAERSGELKNGDKRLRTLDYAEILGRQFVTELDRRKYDLSDMEVQGLVRDIVPRANSIGGMPLFVHHMNSRDRDLMIEYGEDVVREAADESIQEIGWLDDLENELKSLFKYELFVEGTGKREYSNREFEWEDRKEALRQEETTVLQTPAGGRGRYDGHYGITLVNIDASYESIVGAPSAYVRWEKLPVVDKVKVEVQPLQEVSLSLRDSLSEKWYWQGKAMLNGDLDPEVTFNLTRRDEARRNRLTFFAEFGEYERVGVMFGVLL